MWYKRGEEKIVDSEPMGEAEGKRIGLGGDTGPEGESVVEVEKRDEQTINRSRGKWEHPQLAKMCMYSYLLNR